SASTPCPGAPEGSRRHPQPDAGGSGARPGVPAEVAVAPPAPVPGRAVVVPLLAWDVASVVATGLTVLPSEEDAAPPAAEVVVALAPSVLEAVALDALTVELSVVSVALAVATLPAVLAASQTSSAPLQSWSMSSPQFSMAPG